MQVLNDLHKDVRFRIVSDLQPSKVKVQHPRQKCYVLLQAAIGQHHLESFSMRQEMTKMVEYSIRMLNACKFYAIEGTGHGPIALACSQLLRLLNRQSSPFKLKKKLLTRTMPMKSIIMRVTR